MSTAESVVKSSPRRPLLIVVTSSVVGVAYFGYLTTVPFPPDIVRLVPLVWVAACLAGWVSAVRALRTNASRFLPVATLVLNVPNTALAAVFAIAAVMGG